MSSALLVPATFLLQKLSKASFSALWKSDVLLKQVLTYLQRKVQGCRLKRAIIF